VYPPLPDVYSEDLRNLVQQMISIEPKSRPEITSICKIAGQMLKKYSKGYNHNNGSKVKEFDASIKVESDNISDNTDRDRNSGGEACPNMEPCQEPNVYVEVNMKINCKIGTDISSQNEEHKDVITANDTDLRKNENNVSVNSNTTNKDTGNKVKGKVIDNVERQPSPEAQMEFHKESQANKIKVEMGIEWSAFPFMESVNEKLKMLSSDSSFPYAGS
jgi:hypothetical protein